MSSAGPDSGIPSGALPPQKQSQAALWIVVILGSTLAAVIIAGLLLARLVLHRVRIREAGNRVAIETPVGSINVNKAATHPSGLPVYPGATASGDKNASVQIGGDQASVGLATEEYQTTDSIDQVQQWYRHRLGPEFRLETENSSRERRSKVEIDGGEHQLAFVDDRDDGARVVALDRSSGGTKITLLRIGKRDTQ
jgi:hypothetical protein